MSKISDYLRQHLTGEVATDLATRETLSRDGSVLEQAPQLAIYPRTTNDVRKLTRFAWRLAERGQALPITARGGGTSTVGSAVGSGVILSFAAHMSRILELDVKSRLTRVQPGLNLATLEEAMATHGLFLPVMPPDARFATIGGALATNVIGAKSVRYGSLRDWVDRLEVVLANGEIIQTERLSRRELSAKKGLQTMEGEIYRSLDALIDENQETFAKLGADILVKTRDGSFDLTPLIIGSEGSYGIITQAIVKLAPRPDEVGYLAAALTDGQDLANITEELLDLEPSELEFIDGDTLKLIESRTGYQPWRAISNKQPDGLVFVEFDDNRRDKKIKKAAKILAESGVSDAKIATSFEDQETLRSVHHSVSAIANFTDRGESALPLTTNIIVEPLKVPELVVGLKQIFAKNHLEGGIWGSLGRGVISAWPLINLANLGERQTVFKFMNDVRSLVRELGGSAGDVDSGRLGAPFLAEDLGEDVVALLAKIKAVFDPYNTLNPGVRVGVEQKDLVKMLRKDYDRLQAAQFNLRG